MSISRTIIEHIIADNGDKVRSYIHKSISEKVSDLLESKKIELAGGSLVSEEYSEEKEYLIYEMLKNEEKINKLKEEIAILEEYLSIIISEESSCDDDDDDMDEDDVKDAIDEKKKKLKKKEKKAKKMEEEYAILEGYDDDEDDDVARADRELRRMKAKPIEADKKTDPDKEMSKLAKKEPKEVDESVEQIDEISTYDEVRAKNSKNPRIQKKRIGGIIQNRINTLRKMRSESVEQIDEISTYDEVRAKNSKNPRIQKKRIGGIIQNRINTLRKMRSEKE